MYACLLLNQFTKTSFRVMDQNGNFTRMFSLSTQHDSAYPRFFGSRRLLWIELEPESTALRIGGVLPGSTCDKFCDADCQFLSQHIFQRHAFPLPRFLNFFLLLLRTIYHIRLMVWLDYGIIRNSEPIRSRISAFPALNQLRFSIFGHRIRFGIKSALKSCWNGADSDFRS